jgi:biopolymer transport protein ExbD
MIDIVFQLLLFFALSAQFETARALQVKLPAAANAEIDARRDVIVTVTMAGQYFVDGLEVAPAELTSAIRDALAGAPQRVVRVEADAGADVAPAVAALDAARGAGADVATIATQHVADKVSR